MTEHANEELLDAAQSALEAAERCWQQAQECAEEEVLASARALSAVRGSGDDDVAANAVLGAARASLAEAQEGHEGCVAALARLKLQDKLHPT